MLLVTKPEERRGHVAYQPAGSGQAGWEEFGGMRGRRGRRAGGLAGMQATQLTPGHRGLTGRVKGSSCLL